PLTIVSEIGRTAWAPGSKQRRRTLQSVANSLCNVVAEDRRYPNEVRLNHPQGGRLVLDLLSRRCTLNDTDVDRIGLVDRLSNWLHSQLDDARIQEVRICSARVEVEYTAAERTYLASGRVWEMCFSLRSELATPDQSYVGVTPTCTAAVPYGVGAMVSW
ncbi:MAG TPA: hypothetical protein VII66_05210, partial [Gemmatimonadaceae bacterium]